MAPEFPHKTTLAKMSHGAQGEYMNQNAFDHLIREIDFSAHKPTIETLRLIYVKGLDRSEATERTGVDSSALTKAIKRFEEAVEIHAKENGYVHADYVLSKPFAALAMWGESLTLDQSLPNEEATQLNEKAEELIQLLRDIYTSK
jgi:hypothetical protein